MPSEETYEVRFGNYWCLRTEAPASHTVPGLGHYLSYSVALDLELPEWRDRANAGHDEWVYW